MTILPTCPSAAPACVLVEVGRNDAVAAPIGVDALTWEQVKLQRIAAGITVDPSAVHCLATRAPAEWARLERFHLVAVDSPVAIFIGGPVCLRFQSSRLAT